MSKKILAALLAVMMVLTMVPMTALATGAAGAEPIFTGATEDEFAGKTASDVQSGTVKIEKNAEGKYAVSGVTLKKVEGWEAFNVSLKDEQSGYYLALAVPKTAGEAEVSGMILSGRDAGGNPADKTYTGDSLTQAFTDGDGTKCNIFIHLGADAESLKKTCTIKLKYGDAPDYTSYEFDLSGLQVASNTGIAYGFSWKAADANAARNAAIQAAGKTGTVDDSLDQTVWFMVNEPVAGNHYWFEIANRDKVIWEGPMDYEAESTKLGMQAASFLHKGQNPDNALAADDQLTIRVWKTDEAVKAKPEEEATYTETLPTGVPPLRIVEITPDVTANTVNVKFNQDLLGRYYIDIESVEDYDGTVIAHTVTECVAPAPAVEQNEGYTFNGVSLKPGYYTARIGPAMANEDKPNSSSIVKAFILEAETITKISTKVAGLGAAIDGNKIVLTGNMKNADTTVTLSYTTSLSAEEKTVTATYTKADEKWTLGGLTLFGGTTYDLDATGVSFLADNVAVAPLDPVVEVDEEIAEALTNAGFDPKTAISGGDATDILSQDGIKPFIPDEKMVETLLKEGEIDVGTSGRPIKDFTEVHLVSYFCVEVSDYTAATSEKPATITLDIYPMIKRVPAVPASKPGDEPIYGEFKASGADRATIISWYKASEPISFSVQLPAGFVTNDTKNNVIVKHWNSGKNQVLEWLSTTVLETKANYTATFEATTFSPFELTVDARTAAVEYDLTGIESYEGELKTSFKASDIGFVLPVAKKSTGTCIGWTIPGDSTVYTVLTEELFGKLVAANATVTLTPSFRTGGSSSGGSSGGSSGTSGNITVTKPANGTMTSNVSNAKEGDKVTVTVKTDAPYYIVTGVTVKGENGNVVATKNADGTYSFTMPKGSVSVSATISHIYNLFKDVPTDIAEYGTAIKWAVEKGITLGTDTVAYSTFSPYNPCTRAQMVVFLYRAAGSPTVTGTNAFTDVPNDAEIQKAVQWAVSKGITKGTSDTTFDPYAPCTRGQMVTFLHRNHSEPAASGSNNFADVPADAFYKDAVQWAVNEGITKGTGDNTFAPNDACLRVQMVTFLYRDMGK